MRWRMCHAAPGTVEMSCSFRSQAAAPGRGTGGCGRTQLQEEMAKGRGMNYYRSRITTIHSDGTVIDYNPLICWNVQPGMAEISIRNTWAIGIMWKWTIGNWSRFKTWFGEIGKITIYVRYGYCEPYNPRARKEKRCKLLRRIRSYTTLCRK